MRKRKRQMYVSMYVCIYMCIYIHISIYIYIYQYIWISIYICERADGKVSESERVGSNQMHVVVSMSRLTLGLTESCGHTSLLMYISRPSRNNVHSTVNVSRRTTLVPQGLTLFPLSLSPSLSLYLSLSLSPHTRGESGSLQLRLTTISFFHPVIPHL